MLETPTPTVEPKAPQVKDPNSINILTVGPFVMAFLILIGYAFFIVSLVKNVDVADTTWIKLVYIFGSVEAIVFTAVGFLFGREVNRARADNAEQNEKVASAEAKKANKEKNELVKRIDEIPLPTAPSMPSPPAEPRMPLINKKEGPAWMEEFRSRQKEVPVSIQIEKLMNLKSLAKKYSDIE